MLEAISYDEYEKVTRKESAYDILEFLKRSYEQENQDEVTSCEESESFDKSSESESDCALLADIDITEDSDTYADLVKSEEAESSDSKLEKVY